MKNMKKVIALFLCFTMLFALVSCLPAKQNGGPENNLSGKKIEMATQTAGKSNELLVKLIEQFKQETGIEVVLTSYDANDYESALKTRMASQELPDVWETHGWSRIRYGEYLYPVNNEPWYESENEFAKGILTGEGDTAYALMISSSIMAGVWWPLSVTRRPAMR